MAEYNKGTSKEGDILVRELDDIEVPDILKPFCMKTLES